MPKHLLLFLSFSLWLVGRAFPEDSWPASDAIVLRCDAQKLEGHVTACGLRVLSNEKNEAFRLVTRALGREEMDGVSGEGRVETSEKLVRLVRPRLTEEYSVSWEGLRQDFVIHEPPQGSGPLRLVMQVEGAACESIEQGVKLTLAGSGREIAYSKLKVIDARGREHVAKMHSTSPSMIEIVVTDGAAAYPLRIDPTLSDADWVSLNNDYLGTDGTIYCFADDGAGNLYAGGNFSRIGGITTSNIARWDGTRWWPLGSGVAGGQFSSVDCMGFGGGNLYVGGSFSSAGGVPVNRLARWDGTAWHAIGAGEAPFAVLPSSITVDGTNVFVGGTLIRAGGISSRGVARWDGSAWTQVGLDFDGEVNSMLFHGGMLYAGGYFTTAGGNPANCMAVWNGTTWSGLGAGFGGVRRLLMFQGHLLAGGDSGVAIWNGSSWNSLETQEVLDVASNGAELFFLASWWTAAVYRHVPGESAEMIGELFSPFSYTTPECLGSFQGGIFVSGSPFREVRSYDTLTGTSTRANVNNLARWNGSEWRPVSTNINNTVSCMASENGQVVLGGNFTTAGGTDARRVALWNGTSWQALGTGLNSSVIAIAKHGVNVYAAEIVERVSSYQTTCRVQHWNGSSWQVLGGVFDNRILAMQWHGGSLYVAGMFSSNEDAERVMIARWGGMQWEPVGSGIPLSYSPARSMVSLGGDLYVGSADGVAKWDGQSWSMLPQGGSGMLCLYEGQLIAAGGTGFLRWNGAQWSAFLIGEGIGGVTAMAANGPELYVVTEFGGLGGTNLKLHQWNGRGWWTSSSMLMQPGESMSASPITSLAVASPSQLWLGGHFERIGSTLSPYLIQANIPGSTLSTQETWRQTHFGTVNNTGSGADLADYDEDGLSNLLEYALGLNPTQGVSRAMPVPQVSGSNYVISFAQPAGVSGVTYGAEWSATLAPGSWTAIPDTGTSPQHTFSVPLNGNSPVFVRLKITTP